MSSKSKLSWILLGGASLAAMVTPAFAQNAGTTGDVSDEIVVTATGRSAALQDVPVAVTAIPADSITNSGAQDLRALTQLAPSFSMDSGQSTSSGTTARVRGIGTGSDNPGFEAAVGIFIDGVYRARAGAALSDLPDLVRVEVLRGPQGTLFGRNTSAGAISVVTEGPDFDPGVWLQGNFGFDDLEEAGARAGVNVPITDNFAVRIDGSLRSRDGYITDRIAHAQGLKDDINDRDRWSLRGQALWDINDNATLRIIVDSAETDEVCCGITPLLYGTTQGAVTAINTAIFGPTLSGLGSATPSVDGRFMTVTPAMTALPALGPGLPAQGAHGARGYGEQTEEQGASGELDWDLGGVNLTSITAYREWRADRNQDVDFNLIDIAYRDGLKVGFDNFTQEFRLQGEAGRLNWLAGVFYGKETLNTTDTIRVGSMSNLYANAVARGGTTTIATPNGCELYDSTAADSDGTTDPIPSFFLCATGNPAFANVYLTGNTAGQGQQADNWKVDTESLSLFTHDEFNITDALVLTLGVRYNHETKDLSAALAATSTSCLTLQGLETATGPLVPGPGGIVTALQTSSASALMNISCNPAVNPIANGNWRGSSEENEWSGTLSVAYHFTPDVMVYGGYSRGYKAGGYNVDRSGFSITPALTDPTQLNTGQLHFDPEFTDAYEAGLRSTIARHTTINLTGFYQQIHDYQLNGFNGFNFITRNVPEAISQGVELELNSRPIEGLMLNLGITYNDAHYDSEVRFNDLTACLNASSAVVACHVGGVANPAAVGSNPNDPNAVFKGAPFSFAPEWVATAGVGYEVPIGSALKASFYLDARWNDTYRTQTLSREPNGRTDNGSYAIFNGRIGFGSQDDRWSVEFWGRNLFDETYYVGAFQPPLQNSYVVYPNEPATYGVTLRARY